MLALNLWRPEARDFYLALVITWIPESGRVFFSAPWGIHWLELFGDRISRPFQLFSFFVIFFFGMSQLTN